MDGWWAALPHGGALAWLLLAAIAGGLARGFSGFGAALIFIPLASAAIGPRGAAPLMVVLESVAILSLVPGALRLAPRRDVALLSAGLVIGTPAGVAILAAADPLALRWGVAGVILALLALLSSGWRLRGGQGAVAPVAFGTVGGVLGGVATVSGPPALAYLLGRDLPKGQVRAAFNLYLSAGDVLVLVGYLAAGLMTPALVGPAVVTGPAYALGIWLGTRMFGLASEATFRRACYGMILAAALLGLPLWDGVLR